MYKDEIVKVVGVDYSNTTKDNGSDATSGSINTPSQNIPNLQNVEKTGSGDKQGFTGDLVEGNTLFYENDKGPASIKLKVDGREFLIHDVEDYPSKPSIAPDKKRLAYVAPCDFETSGEVYIYDLATDTKQKVVNIQDMPLQYSAKEVTWYDNRYLLVVAGYTYGTINFRSHIYMYDTVNKQLQIVYKENDGQIIIADLKVENSDIMLDLAVYNEQFTSHTTEKKIIRFKDFISKEQAESKVSEYVFDFSDKQLLSDENVKYLNNNLRMLARNEIYARHGYVFEDCYLKKYFESCSWYVPNSSFKGDFSELNDIEKKNIDLIKKYESENGNEYGNRSFTYQDKEVHTARAKFDLNGDGKQEDIEYIKNGKRNRTFALRVDDAIIEGYGDNLSERFAITNLSGRKGSYEIVIYDDGPSDDPIYRFYCYNGMDVLQMGTCSGYTLIPDGQGKIFTSFSYINGVKMLSGQAIPLSWYEINDDRKIVIKRQDRSKLIGQKIQVIYGDWQDGNEDSGIKLFPSSASNPYGTDFVTTVKKGDILTVLDLEIGDFSRGAAIKVKTEDEKVGWRVHMFGGD